jgi:tetratricopeptide (TPR) repeat protein
LLSRQRTMAWKRASYWGLRKGFLCCVSKTVILGALLLAGMLALPGVQAASESAYGAGKEAFQNEQFGKAYTAFKQVQQEQGSHALLHYYLAETCLRLKRWPEAQFHYQEALALTQRDDSLEPSLESYCQQRLSMLQSVELDSYQWAYREANRKASSISTGTHNSTAADLLYGLEPEGPNYLDRCYLSGKLVRWSLRKQPIRLFLSKSTQGLKNMKSTYPGLVASGLLPWQKALGGQLQVIQTPRREEADITIDFTDGVDTKGVQSGGGSILYTAGITVPIVSGNLLKRMEIRLATLNIRGNPVQDSDLYGVAVHEFGHALGLLGHSPAPSDVMYAESERTEGQVSTTALTPRDIATIRKLYGVTAEITHEPNRPVQALSSVQSGKQLQAVEEELAKRQQEVAARPTILNYVNLANGYLQKAEAIEQYAKSKGPDSQKAAQPLIKEALQQSLEAANIALKQDPKNLEALKTRVNLYDSLKQYPAALTDCQTALGVSPKEPKLHIQYAWLLSKTGKTTEAKNELQQALLLDPNAQNDPYFQKVSSRLEKVSL